jgi:UTP--glucose-1-phosphate uridylyltransferase
MLPHELDAFLQRMTEGDCHPVAQAMFRFYFAKFRAGETGEIPEESIEPPTAAHLLHYDQLPEVTAGIHGRVAMIKLNGGLGTSMGLTKAKSLLEVKPDVTFLDVIAQQALQVGVPLVLMNSFSTHEDTMQALAERHPELQARGLLHAFVQNRFPRIEMTGDTARPLSLADEAANWNPPGHGDLYPSILISGILDALLEQGVEVAFVSNSDNLGAVMDWRIAGHMLAEGDGLPFLMEVRERGEMDRKGGHLALRSADDQLVLREVAQCPEHQMDAFQDIRRYGYFNTNNLWVNLRSLKAAMDEAGEGFLPLPMIRNRKSVAGHDVVQLETAMGAAVEMFHGAAALVVPRSRYAPVKTTNHLLVVRSDAYELEAESQQLVLTGGRIEPPTVTLNPDHYKTVPQLDRAFPDGIPSLRECTSLTIESDTIVPADAKLVGDVVLR